MPLPTTRPAGRAAGRGASAVEIADLRRQVEELNSRAADAEETLRAIRGGEVDALVMGAIPGTERVFTLSSADRPYRNFVENMSDGAATVSDAGIILYANSALATLLASCCSRVVGQRMLDAVTTDTEDRLASVIGPKASRGSVEVSLRAGDDGAMPVRVSSSSVMIEGQHVTCLTFTDLTAERRAEAEVLRLAQHDALTGLPNRTLLADRIGHALARRASDETLTALFFCDVDGFKNVNDARGHQVGDAVLTTVAARLRSVLRAEDTVARIGGDEFVLLCEGLTGVEEAAMVAARACAAVAAPMQEPCAGVEVTMSIGISVACRSDDANADTLLRDADEAMYKAKRQGANTYELFDDSLRTAAASRLALLSDLRHAASDGEFRLVYQPVLTLVDECVVGFEALIRWQHPSGRLVSPDAFIPFAERSGLIIEIGDWVMQEACRQGAAWAAAEPLIQQTMSVNVSGRQLAHGAGLYSSVRWALEQSGFDPTRLVLEVTESALMDDAEAALQVVHELKSLGIQVAIDDFGMGYSSLLYLKRFPVDLLKVDRSFVSGVGQNRDDTAIVRSVVDLAHAFGIAAVAEGVETEAQLAVLQSFGCRYGQGYLWGPGRAPAELGEDFLSSARCTG